MCLLPPPPPAAAVRRASPVPHLDRAIELTLLARVPWAWYQEDWPHHPSSAMWWLEWGKKGPPFPCPLPTVADGRAGPRATMMAGELVLSPTSCSTGERRHSTSLRQHTRADLVGWGAGEPGLWLWKKDPAPFLVCQWMARVREICLPTHIFPSATGHVGELVLRAWAMPCPSPNTSIQTPGPAAHLGKTAELALVAWVQMSWTLGCESRRTLLLVVCCVGWPSHGSAGRLTWMIAMRESLPTQPSLRPSTRTMREPNPTPPSSRNCQSMWRRWAYKSTVPGFPCHKPTIGYARGVPVKTQDLGCSRSQRLLIRPKALWNKLLQVNVYGQKGILCDSLDLTTLSMPRIF